MDIEGLSALADFEVIEVMDDRNSHHALLGIDWATDMNRVINLKKKKMISEKKPLHIIVCLDPAKGLRYTEPVCDYESNDIRSSHLLRCGNGSKF